MESLNLAEPTHKLNSYSIRKIILEQSMRAKVGHIGSALSIADILVALYSKVLNIPDYRHPDRDRFILSKGHAALALYAALFLQGVIPESVLNTYGCDDTLLGVHPEHRLPGIDFCTGSLGQGLPIGTGASLAARMQKSKRRIFVLISDGECNEGSVWEGVMFAAHHQLSNLIVLIDLNGQQALDYTENVINPGMFTDRWQSFGWDVHQVDGHNVEQITAVVSDLNTVNGPPHVLITRTTFGKGVSFMENQIKWHYMPMIDDEYQLAIKQIEDLCVPPL